MLLFVALTVFMYLSMWALPAYMVGRWAEYRGRNRTGWTVASLVIPWPLTFALVLLWPALGPARPAH